MSAGTNTRAERISLDDLGVDLQRLAMAPEDAYRLTATQRGHRLDALLEEAETILCLAITRMVHAAPHAGRQRKGRGYQLAGVVGLCSGGNDSTVCCDIVRRMGLLTHLAHANTGVGVEDTRQYVRDLATGWQVPLLERRAHRPQDSYESLVMAHGFPGYGRHRIVQQKLKGHALELVRNELVAMPTRQRVVFVAGRRRTESQQRTQVPELERIGSVVWISPLVNFTKADLTTYRLRHPEVPRNEVADLLHMSAECLCGCYARPGEREEVGALYPRAFDLVADLEARLAGPEGDHLPPHVKTWGWSNDPAVVKPPRANRRRKAKASAMDLCDACETRGPHDHQEDAIAV